MAQQAGAVVQKGESVVELQEIQFIVKGRPVGICYGDSVLIDNNGAVFNGFNFVERHNVGPVHPHKFTCGQLFFQRFKGGMDGVEFLGSV